MRHETGAQRVLITERGEHNQPRVVIALGCTPDDSVKLAAEIDSLQNEEERDRYGKKRDAEIIFLKSANGPSAVLYLAPRSRSKLPVGMAIEPLLRVVELGMDVCAFRAGSQKSGGSEQPDEIGDLPLDVQPKLLRFLQEGEIQPLGEQRPSKVDVRIIAATNTDLEEMVAQARFREDLYYRLNVIRLRVPPLRERRSEIPTIVNYYMNHYSAKFGRKDLQITPQAVDLLMVSNWPGNVRQLCNEIQRTVARAEDGAVIGPDQLSPELKRTSSPTAPSGASIASMPNANLQNVTLAIALAEVERRMIADALRRHNGNISRAARELGLTRRGLCLKLERHELSASA